MINIFKTSRREYIKQIQDAADNLDPKIRQEFLKAVENIQDSIVLKEIADTIEALGVGAASTLVDIDRLGKSYQGMFNVIAGGIGIGGAIGAKHASDILRPSQPIIGGAEFIFDQMNPAAVEFTQQYQQTLIREISTSTRETVEQIISRSVTEGRNPLDAAREIKLNIGLTARQEQAVNNYRKYLETLDRAALDRKLRDKRYDSTINRAIASEKALSKDQVDRMVGRYRERYIKYRSETIGRTESLRAVNSGNKLYWNQAVDEGLVDQQQIRREWIYTHDSKTREAHRLIPQMNKGGVGLNEPFQSIEGPIMYPHDPNATAANTINCFLPDTKVEGIFVGALKSFYSGEAIKIVTGSGNSISVTPNHPVLTARGWVAANDITKDDKLVTTNNRIKESIGIAANHKQSSPTTIEEVFCSFSKLFSPFSIGRIGVDFNGDEEFINGNIDIVFSNSSLMRESNISFDELIDKISFEKSSLIRIVLSKNSPLTQFGMASFDSSDSIMSGSNLSFDGKRIFFDGSPFYGFCFGSPAWFDSMFTQNSLNDISTNTKMVGSRFNTDTGGIHIEGRNFINDLDVASTTVINAILDKLLFNSCWTAPDFFSDKITTFPGLIQFDSVSDFSVFEYSGHVYDLQSVSGMILADGYVFSNCRCTEYVRVVSRELL